MRQAYVYCVIANELIMETLSVLLLGMFLCS